MVLPQPTTAGSPVEKRRYVGEERRQLAGTRQSASSAKVRLVWLSVVALTAIICHLSRVETWHLPTARAVAAGLLGLPIAAAFLYFFRFGLLRDAFSLEIGAVVVVSCVALGAGQAGLMEHSWAPTGLAALVFVATFWLSRTLRRAVVNTQIRPVRRVSAIALTSLGAAAVGAGSDILVRRQSGAGAGRMLTACVGVAGLVAVALTAQSALRRRRAVATAAVACLAMIASAAALQGVVPSDSASLGISLLWLACSLVVLEASVGELRSAFSHEQGRIIDLFMLSREQQQALEAERTASATRRHDQKASVIAIEGAITALAGDAGSTLPTDTRVNLTTAVKAELARLRRGLERSNTVDIEPVALREVLNPMIVCMRSEGVNVRLTVPTGMVVETSTDTLLEIVQNLVDNAAIHGHNRSIVVRARLVDRGFELEVSDRGPGVPEALRHVIFDRGVTSRAADHSGLGLFSAQQLAQRIGGQLRVESGRRGGARFVLHVSSVDGHRVA
jgi:signal transduction histidine kinase